MSVTGKTTPYQEAQSNLVEMVESISHAEKTYINSQGRTLHVPGADAVLLRLRAAQELMMDEEPSEEALQNARNQILDVRKVLGYYYDRLPMKDGLINRCDKVLKGLPGEGEPSELPFEVWNIIGEAI